MQEDTLISPTEDSKKDLLFFTLLGLAIAIVTSLLLAILIHGDGSGDQTFVREPDTLPGITISVSNPDENGIVDVYCKLYYTDVEVKTDDILINGIKLRFTAENGEFYLDPNLLGDGKGYLAIEVVEPKGYSIEGYNGSNVKVHQYTYNDSILIADLQNTDTALSDVSVQIKLSESE